MFSRTPISPTGRVLSAPNVHFQCGGQRRTHPCDIKACLRNSIFQLILFAPYRPRLNLEPTTGLVRMEEIYRGAGVMFRLSGRSKVTTLLPMSMADACLSADAAIDQTLTIAPGYCMFADRVAVQYQDIRKVPRKRLTLLFSHCRHCAWRCLTFIGNHKRSRAMHDEKEKTFKRRNV